MYATSGDMVTDILSDWKEEGERLRAELDGAKAELKPAHDLLRAYRKSMRDVLSQARDCGGWWALSDEKLDNVMVRAEEHINPPQTGAQ